MSPPGMRVPRFWCPRAGASVSLLPEFLAAHVTGTLDELEEAVLAAEQAPTKATAVEAVRPADAADAVSLPSAERWLRRRQRWVESLLRILITLLPDALLGASPTMVGLRAHLETDRALLALRRLADEHLGSVPAPVGLAPRARR